MNPDKNINDAAEEFQFKIKLDSNIDSYSNKADKLSVLIKEMLDIINPSANEEIVKNTPMRYAKALLELTKGYNENYEEIISDAIFPSEGFNDVIVVRDINFNSLCEHHLLPFHGDCCIGYIPNKKLLGLSKFARLVQSLSAKFSLQERLTKEIAEILNNTLQPEGIVVKISSIHSCMCFRGVRSFNSKTETIYTLGSFKNHDNLSRFFSMIKN